MRHMVLPCEQWFYIHFSDVHKASMSSNSSDIPSAAANTRGCTSHRQQCYMMSSHWCQNTTKETTKILTLHIRVSSIKTTKPLWCWWEFAEWDIAIISHKCYKTRLPFFTIMKMNLKTDKTCNLHMHCLSHIICCLGTCKITRCSEYSRLILS